MKRLGMLAALLLVAGGLGGCMLIPAQPPANPITVTANTNNLVPVYNVTVPSNDTVSFDVTLPGSVLSYPIITFELDPGSGGPNLNLSLIDYTTYYTLASSSSPYYFAQGTAGLASLSTAAMRLSRQSINALQTCYSSCIIWPTGATHYYVTIGNPTSGSVNVNLYAYGQDYTDSNEAFGNNTFGTAVPLASGSSGDSGAIETLGDNDFWWVSSAGGGYLTFSPSDNTTPVGLTVDIFDSSRTYQGTCYTTSPCNFPLVYGDYLDVYSDNYTAGPSGSSGYNLTY